MVFSSTEPDPPGTLPHDPSSYLQTSVGTSDDSNLPEAFQHNLQLVQQHTRQVQSLARSALAEMKNADPPSTNPSQASADMANLKQAIHNLLETMRQSGVGALPFRAPTPSPSYPGPGTEADPSMGVDGMNTNQSVLDASMNGTSMNMNAGAGGLEGVPSEEKMQ